MSCACLFMFTADSTRGPSLDDTRISRPVMRKQRCKVFLQAVNDSLPTDDTDLTDFHAEDALHSQSRRGGSRGNMLAKHILRFISLQITISHYNSHSAKGMSYLCTTERDRPSPHPPKGGSSYNRLSRALMQSRTLQTK